MGKVGEGVTPLERAARALWENSLLRPHHLVDVEPGRPELSGAPDWQRFLPLARAVLTAIREPSEGMIDEAYASYHANGGSLRDVFMDMIDVALEEE